MKDHHEDPKTPLVALQSVVTFRIARVYNQLNSQAIATLAAHSDLTLTEWRVIYHIQSELETTAANIARQSQLDKGQISRTIRSLKDAGFVISAEHERDSRQSKLKLTKAGQSAFEKVHKVMQRRQSLLVKDINERDLNQFLSVLDRLENRAKETVK